MHQKAARGAEAKLDAASGVCWTCVHAVAPAMRPRGLKERRPGERVCIQTYMPLSLARALRTRAASSGQSMSSIVEAAVHRELEQTIWPEAAQ